MCAHESRKLHTHTHTYLNGEAPYATQDECGPIGGGCTQAGHTITLSSITPLSLPLLDLPVHSHPCPNPYGCLVATNFLFFWPKFASKQGLFLKAMSETENRGYVPPTQGQPVNSMYPPTAFNPQPYQQPVSGAPVYAAPVRIYKSHCFHCFCAPLPFARCTPSPLPCPFSR